MTTSKVSGARGSVLLPIVIALASAIVSACGGGGAVIPLTAGGGSGGGGGPTVNATPYTLYASGWQAYANATTAPYIHSLQNGDLFTFNSTTYGYGNYSSGQSDITFIGHYALQVETLTGYASSANDYYGYVIGSPGSHGSTASVPFDISQSGTMIIRMGNPLGTDATHGNANVFTVEMNNALPGGSGATDVCDYDQTLAVVGPAGTSGNAGVAQNGILDYEIPFTGFTCSTGTLADLQKTGITNVAIKIVGSKNSKLTAANMFDIIALAYIGFTK